LEVQKERMLLIRELSKEELDLQLSLVTLLEVVCELELELIGNFP
jgi:hypothetical protein